MPTIDQAAVYSATLHYLKAVAAAKSTDGPKVADEIRNLPVDDFYVHNGSVRKDGWLMHDFYVATIKAPNEVEEPWDYYNILRTIPPRMRHNHCRKAAAHSYAIQLIAANIYGDDA